MFRRIVITLTFVAALGAAGVGLASKAAAHGGCENGNYNSSYGGYATYNGYRGVYYGGYPNVYSTFYGPSVAYSGSYGGLYIPNVGPYHPRRHRHHDHDGITVAIGF